MWKMCKERNRRAVKPPANIFILCENTVCESICVRLVYVCVCVNEHVKVRVQKTDEHKQSKSL